MQTGPLNMQTGPLNMHTGPLNMHTGPLNMHCLIILLFMSMYVDEQRRINFSRSIIHFHPFSEQLKLFLWFMSFI